MAKTDKRQEVISKTVSSVGLIGMFANRTNKNITKQITRRSKLLSDTTDALVKILPAFLSTFGEIKSVNPVSGLSVVEPANKKEGDKKIGSPFEVFDSKALLAGALAALPFLLNDKVKENLKQYFVGILDALGVHKSVINNFDKIVTGAKIGLGLYLGAKVFQAVYRTIGVIFKAFKLISSAISFIAWVMGLDALKDLLKGPGKPGKEAPGAPGKEQPSKTTKPGAPGKEQPSKTTKPGAPGTSVPKVEVPGKEGTQTSPTSQPGTATSTIPTSARAEPTRPSVSSLDTSKFKQAPTGNGVISTTKKSGAITVKEAERRISQGQAAKQHNAARARESNPFLKQKPAPAPAAPSATPKGPGVASAVLNNSLVGLGAIMSAYNAKQKYEAGDKVGAAMDGFAATAIAVGLISVLAAPFTGGASLAFGSTLIGIGNAASWISFGRDIVKTLSPEEKKELKERDYAVESAFVGPALKKAEDLTQEELSRAAFGVYRRQKAGGGQAVVLDRERRVILERQVSAAVPAAPMAYSTGVGR